MNRRTINAALVAVLFVGLIVVATQVLSGARQVSNPAASTLDFSGDGIKFLFLPEMSKAQLFILLTVFTLGSLVGLTGGLAFLFRFLNKEVKEAQAAPVAPTNPLSYDSYGHFAGLALVIGLTLLSLLFWLGPGSFPIEGGQEATITDRLFRIEFVIMSLLFGLVAGLFVHFAIYYRARKGDLSDGKFIHGDTRLEAAWIILPTILVIILGVLAGFWLQDITEAQEGEVTVGVVGRQWGWQFSYSGDAIPEDLRNGNNNLVFTSSTLAMMIDQTVVLEMTSVDVIHSFWVPELRQKQDVVPGTITELRLTGSTVGEYRVRCAELCGTQHNAMYAPVMVMDEGAYHAWVAGEIAKQGNPVTAGQNLYETKGCSGCHSLDGTRIVGPTWQNLYGSEREFTDGSSIIADIDYLHNAIINPNSQIVNGFTEGLMPQNYGEQLLEVEIEQLIDYIRSLSPQGIEELKAEGILDENGVPIDLTAGGSTTTEDTTNSTETTDGSDAESTDSPTN